MTTADSPQPPEKPVDQDSQQTDTGGGPDRSSASAEEAQKAVSDLAATLLQLRDSFSALAENVASLVKAESALAAFVVKERSRLFVIRVVMFALALFFFVACWFFINVTIWHVVKEFTRADYWAPLVLAALNGLVGYLIFTNTDRFRL